jgi:hypothetical protein
LIPNETLTQFISNFKNSLLVIFDGMSSENRGLASADEETRERVAREGGEARAEDKESLREAGRKGGEK